MVRNYSIKLIKALLNAINAGKVDEVVTYKDYMQFTQPAIKIGNISVLFVKQDDRYDTIMYLPTHINSEYIRQWRGLTSGGKFLIKDFKKQNKDYFGNTLYTKIVYTVEGQKYQALIRLLIELNDETISSENKEALITGFADITIDNNVYSIIKIIPLSSYSWAGEDVYAKVKTLPQNDYNYSYSDNFLGPENLDESNNDENLNPLF